MNQYSYEATRVVFEPVNSSLTSPLCVSGSHAGTQLPIQQTTKHTNKPIYSRQYSNSFETMQQAQRGLVRHILHTNQGKDLDGGSAAAALRDEQRNASNRLRSGLA